jgi:hypothetical protein
VTDHVKREALRVAFPAVIAAAKALCDGDPKDYPEYVRGVVETICDTFEVPNNEGGYFDRDDTESARAEVYHLITGVSETPWGRAPLPEYPSAENLRTEAIIARTYAEMLSQDPTAQFEVQGAGGENDTYDKTAYIHNLGRFADTMEAAAVKIERVEQ